jgi:hypothetical protein
MVSNTYSYMLGGALNKNGGALNNTPALASFRQRVLRLLLVSTTFLTSLNSPYPCHYLWITLLVLTKNLYLFKALGLI